MVFVLESSGIVVICSERFEIFQDYEDIRVNSELRTLKSLDSLERLDHFDRPESLRRLVKFEGLRYFEFLLDLNLTTGDTRQTFIAIDSHRKENEIRDWITKQCKC